MKAKFSRRHRLAGRKSIGEIFRAGFRAGDGRLLLIGRPNGRPDGLVRGAVLVSRRHGSAVRRNRIKRLCREALRLERENLPAGFDFLLLPRTEQERQGADLSLGDLRKSLLLLARRLARRQGPRLPP